ncbi:metallophosphoesterase [Halovivax limisalsi]|uniref:metallophosphoesterase n=1 Tax=Halovivax limisalsi TaxID=1453760 RepID=UPI001FFC5CA0|nr:metallophosphoesterase [Halovivax limisalsi]
MAAGDRDGDRVPPEDRVYYVISDLHIGGDEQLEEVEFIDELIAFLERIERADEPIELVINGDAFGLWEFTDTRGVEKFDRLEATYPDLFAQLRATGETAPITLVPGNHDHELAAHDEYVDRFAAYNVDVVQEPSITRSVGEAAIHFEHGHQRDPNNRIEDWGNPHASPLGYHYNTRVVSRAGALSDRGRFNWLKDVQAVTPTEWLPLWILSKYVYREMNPVLRYAIVPFLLLFNVSALLAILVGLDRLGVESLPIEAARAFLGNFGMAGSAAYAFLAANIAAAGLLLLLAVPLYLVQYDVKRTIDRFGVFDADLTVDAEKPYEAAAREIFDERPETAVFCYGHTHRPSLRRVGDGLLVNTGTWLKRLHRLDGVTGLLPPVFYPTYQLAAVRIAAEAGGIAVSFEAIEKPTPAPEELTLTERLLTIGRKPDPTLPDRRVLALDRQREPTPTPAREP